MESPASLVSPLRSLPLSCVLLCAAIAIYAVAGSPTPDHPGWPEILVGGLLVLSVASSGLSKNMSFLLSRSGYLKALQIFFLTGLVLPTVAGAYLGVDKGLMLRDLLAFAFLGLALFLTDKFKTHPGSDRILCGFLLFAGLAFCVRTLMPAFNIWIPQGELLYLSNSPLALFAAVYLAGRIWVSLESISRADAMQVVFCLAGLGALIAAMLLDVQRATVGAVILTWAVMAVTCLVRHPRRILLPLLLTGIFTAVLYPWWAEAVQAMAAKTSAVGLNARVAEARAVYDVLALYPPSLVAGQGWGATFSSPAVGGLSVNYTHSFLTTMALKGGLILLVLAVLMTGAALHQVFLIFRQDRVRGLALFWALVIPVFLYASHKSLDFGLVLLMIGVWSIDPAPLHKSHTSCKKKEHP